MPQQQSKQPDFIPAQPDFIPAESTTTPEQPQGNAVQRAFDKLTTVTPEQEAGHGPVVNALQHFGAGAIQGATGPFVHPIDTATNAMHAIAHPIDSLHADVDQVRAHPAQALGILVGAGATGMAAEGAGAFAGKYIPTTGKAGAVFEDLNKSLANQPVNLTNSAPHLDQLTKIDAAGPGFPSTVNKLVNRSQATFPMNYPEARLFQENLSNPSVTEKAGMGGSMKGGIKQLKGAFYDDIHDAASQAGRGEDYAKAMRDYKIASTAGNIAKRVGQVGAGIAAPAAGYKIYKAFEGGR